MIQEISGQLKSEQLGFCHSHEHLFLKKGPAFAIDSSLLLDDYILSKKEVNQFVAAGGCSIVDAQPVGAGRNAKWLYQLSNEENIHIIASTGFHKLMFYPKNHWIHTQSVEGLAELFIEELTTHLYADGEDGIPTEIVPNTKAGLIKVASDFEGVGGKYYRLFHAAAIAANKTGAPIMTHTELGYGALDQIKFFEYYNIPPEQLIICHLERKVENLDYMLHVASTGVFMELDTIGRYKYHSDEDEVKIIKKLIQEGYENQLLLSLDTTRKRMKSYGGEIGLTYILQTFIPLLLENGVTKDCIKKMMVDNPARAFSNRRD